MYILSMIVSLFTLVLNIIMLFAEPESDVFRFFGETESYYCLGIAVALFIIGFITTKDEVEE